jgi:hypothetical protein
MLAEPFLMRVLDPSNVDWTVEANNCVDAAVWADCCVARLVAVAPLRNSRRRKFGEAVVADCYLASEQLLSVH